MSVSSMVQPFVLDLEITNACPADCPMCPRDKLPSIGLMSEKTFDNVLKFVDQSKKPLLIGFCGIGEPLLHPKIFDYIAKLKQLEFIPHILIVTAGERLTPEVFEKLKSLGVDSINFSLQALDEELYKKLMPGLKLEKVLKNLDYISQNLNSRLNFTISLTVHKINESNVDEVMEYAKSKKLAVKVSKIHARGGNMVDSSLADAPPISFVPLKTCKIFETINFISWNGDIHPCCQDVERINKIGNINDDTMNDIAIRKTGLLANGLNYKICNQCNDELRNNILTDKNVDEEQQQKIDQKLCFEIYSKIGLFGENFFSSLGFYNTPQDLLTNLEPILKDMARTINFLTYLRKKYPKLSIEVDSLNLNQVIDEKILNSMNISKDNLEQKQISDIYSYLIDKYGLFSEKIFDRILQMPKQEIISMVYKHFKDVHQFLDKDINLMFLFKEKMAKKQIPILSGARGQI